ncbi:hypothetical protein [Gimesia maris]|uniref:DUF3899 domain-containing protein n=1 Tax=Gimesia maris TaxID=122 RepID=A0ABX5YI08_9PLAN|nr:hypothetical protein [Gimesia maris]EDL56027.1 hypothetical protein PM8797T_03710 [Gimesia maris DSM 8797]QEG15217.1 hypothetical protein GmarT_10560 [Gimesia maris]QGQ31444.1 hypothetical protein F1729_23975 [Gimesia maris]
MRKNEKRMALIFLISLFVFSAFFYFSSSYPNSVVWGAFGGLLALYGVILMALPVLRVGPFQWIANLYFDDLLIRDGLKEPPTAEEKKRIEAQRKSDLVIQQIFGPYLIGIGTFVNGISGFFSG